MYTTLIDERDFAIKPMNCPGSILIYNNGLHSYKDLPIGWLNMVMSTVMNQAVHLTDYSECGVSLRMIHIYCRKDQLQSEIKRLLKLL